jgi:hypothetical protein
MRILVNDPCFKVKSYDEIHKCLDLVNTLLFLDSGFRWKLPERREIALPTYLIRCSTTGDFKIPVFTQANELEFVSLDASLPKNVFVLVK